MASVQDVATPLKVDLRDQLPPKIALAPLNPWDPRGLVIRPLLGEEPAQERGAGAGARALPVHQQANGLLLDHLA